MDTCPRLKSTERTNVGDLEAVVRMQVVRMQAAVDTCPERMHAAGMRRFFCCTRKKKKKQELKAAG